MTTEFPTYASPGVTTSEIDLSGPSSAMPVGVPAGVVGTADEGPAFVPVTIGTYDDFARIFGPTDGVKFGPLAVNQWFRNAQSCTYLRVLGVGDGKKRSTDTGAVTNAGFVIGNELIQENGLVGTNKKAYSVKAGTTTTTAQDGLLGRTFFLGAFHSQSLGSTIFSDAGLQSAVGGDSPLTGSSIIRAIVMAPSGVTLSLSGNNVRGSEGGIDDGANNPVAGIAATVAGPYGACTGSANISNQEFVMILNGHINAASAGAPNVITASFDMSAPNYLANVFNSDPLEIQTKGHLLYSHYDIHPDLYTLTGSGILSGAHEDWTHGLPGQDGSLQDVAFIVSGAAGRNSFSSLSPNYESFQNRFTIAATPWITSQNMGGSGHKLFRVHSVDDGVQPRRTTTTEPGRRRVKISIEGLKRNSSTTSDYGTFDLLVRDFADNDREPVVLEQFRGLSLDPGSDRFIARVIGDQNTYYDFDKNPTSQRIVVDGDFPVKSNFIRVEQSVNLKAGQVPAVALPVGCQGPSHLITSGSGPLTTIGDPGTPTSGSNFWGTSWEFVGKRSVEPPIPYRQSVAIGTDPNKLPLTALYWGVQWTQKTSATQPNKPGVMDASMFAYSKYYSDFHPSNFNFAEGANVGKATTNGTVRDCNIFNNNEFSLEKIRVVTGSDGLANQDMWVSASYQRPGNITVDSANKYRAWKVADLDNVGNRKYSKFNILMQGGSDGTDLFNEDRMLFKNAAAKREMDDSTNQGGLNGSTVASFRKAVDIMGEKSDVDIKLLVIPGIRHSAITDYAIDAIENRFDAMYIMDIEERDTVNTVVTSSVQEIDVTNTVSSFLNRGLDSSFAAAYFPDVIMTDPTTITNVRVPPSVAVLGAFALNDAIGFPWFAPAGFTRGALSDVLFSTVSLNKENMDDLYEADINPITSFPGSGLMVFGQKTLLAAQSSLDRVNVRRLLINIRRSVRTIANSILFEPNREETLAKFSSLVNPILQSIQEKQGVERFKVIIDTTTTTQADVENNTLRGKIFLQPTRTAEFISLDFVVANASNFENV